MAVNPIVVLKFGGSVLEDAESVERVCRVVTETIKGGRRVVVVVSAMKGMTDQLLALMGRVREGVEPSLLDEVLAVGERIAARQVHSVLQKKGVRSVVVEPGTDYWPIITDANHQDANPLVKPTRVEVRRKILPLLKKGIVPVVCGFIGVTKEGRITTLGRGGSDTTAVILGSSLNAEEVILIKDVDGVYSSDPDVIERPVLIERLEASEAEMLASSGAKFLHSKALRYMSPELRIRVTNLDNMDAGTIIQGDIPELEVSVGKDRVKMLTVILNDGNYQAAASEIGDIISRGGGRIIAMAHLENAVIAYCSGREDAEKELHTLLVSSGKAKAITSFNDITMITVRGKSLETRPGLIQRISQPLARKNINIYGMITIFSSVRLFVSHSRSGEAAMLIREALGVRG
jgi:aspartate kinase